MLVGYFHDSNFFAALLTNCFILLHTCWGVLFYDGLEKRCWIRLSSVLLSHMLVSLLVSCLSEHTVLEKSYLNSIQKFAASSEPCRSLQCEMRKVEAAIVFLAAKILSA